MDVSISDPKAPQASSLPFKSSTVDQEKASPAYSANDILLSPAAERRMILKVDLAVMPILFLLFLVSFVDRSNLANARIEGLEGSLHISRTSNGYNVALFSFTIPYVLFEVPANILLKRIRPNWWLSGLMFSWGICTIGQGFTQNLSAAILAGAFSGFLAYLLAKMTGVGGYEGWRWIFIIEGLVTVVIAAIAFFLIAPWPEDCNFLKPQEKEMLLERVAMNRGHVKHDALTLKAFITTLTDWEDLG
ncbi:MAG: hypothetical protein Q9186_001457 [Xanthomendoza sp. 1 TL-2023]